MLYWFFYNEIRDIMETLTSKSILGPNTPFQRIFEIAKEKYQNAPFFDDTVP